MEGDLRRQFKNLRAFRFAGKVFLGLGPGFLNFPPFQLRRQVSKVLRERRLGKRGKGEKEKGKKENKKPG
jgi:hypothetical protein